MLPCWTVSIQRPVWLGFCHGGAHWPSRQTDTDNRICCGERCSGRELTWSDRTRDWEGFLEQIRAPAAPTLPWAHLMLQESIVLSSASSIAPCRPPTHCSLSSSVAPGPSLQVESKPSAAGQPLEGCLSPASRPLYQRLTLGFSRQPSLCSGGLPAWHAAPCCSSPCPLPSPGPYPLGGYSPDTHFLAPKSPLRRDASSPLDQHPLFTQALLARM